MQHLITLENRIREANTNLRQACEEAWPEGTTVRFVYSRKQIKPSCGTIHSWSGGDATVKCEKLNRRGYQSYKRVHWSNLR